MSCHNYDTTTFITILLLGIAICFFITFIIIICIIIIVTNRLFAQLKFCKLDARLLFEREPRRA